MDRSIILDLRAILRNDILTIDEYYALCDVHDNKGGAVICDYTLRKLLYYKEYHNFNVERNT